MVVTVLCAGTPLAAFLSMRIPDEVIGNRLEPAEKGPLVTRLESADSLGCLNHRLVEDVVDGDETFQIAGYPPGDVALKAIVVQQKYLRHGGPITFDGLMKQFGFEVSDGHGNHQD